tara:strand:- start:226 stop:729 length:504 start_codon:yes stop_codon:yes gene_type:complete
MYPQQVKRRESNAEERQIDSDIEYNLDEARKKLDDLLKNKDEKGKSWVFIKKKSYLKVATLLKVLRDVFKHNLILKTKVVHDCEHRIVIMATLRKLDNSFLSSGIAERFKDQKSSNPHQSRAVECCQTAAWGRAIKSLLAVGTEQATADEFGVNLKEETENIEEEIV